MKRAWCRGAGTLAPVKPPTSLVDCPVCGRRNLNGELPSAHGAFDDSDDGRTRYAVPIHREAPPSLGEALRAHAANARAMRSEDDACTAALGRWYDSREWGR